MKPGAVEEGVLYLALHVPSAEQVAGSACLALGSHEIRSRLESCSGMPLQQHSPEEASSKVLLHVLRRVLPISCFLYSLTPALTIKQGEIGVMQGKMYMHAWVMRTGSHLKGSEEGA